MTSMNATLPSEVQALPRAGSVRYPGDVEHIVGEIKGPTTYGSPLLAVEATYDRASDRTTVGFVVCPDQVTETAERDADGTWRTKAVG